MCFYLFFFKQETAYEMRISDWSSDVCSSDLDDHLAYALFDTAYPDKAVGVFTGDAMFVGDVGRTDFYPDRREEVAGLLFDSLRKLLARSEERRVGKEFVSPLRSRWSPYH